MLFQRMPLKVGNVQVSMMVMEHEGNFSSIIEFNIVRVFCFANNRSIIKMTLDLFSSNFESSARLFPKLSRNYVDPYA